MPTSAVFEAVLTLIREHEGPYSNDRDDYGGETVYGVARKKHSEWPGWERVDQLKAVAGGDPRRLAQLVEEDLAILHHVADFYHAYWRGVAAPGIDLDSLPPALAYSLFDMGVTSPRGAVEALQIAMCAVSPGLALAFDGLVGPRTREALAAVLSVVPVPRLVEAYARARVIRQVRRVERDASQLRFLEGWCRRAFLCADEALGLPASLPRGAA